jgi:lathosterol oxidase
MKNDLPRRMLNKIPHFALLLSVLCLLTILCFVFPEYLTTPAIRSNYPIPLIREMMYWALMIATATTIYSALFSQQRKLAFASMAILVACAFLGGSQVHQKPEYDTFIIQIGLDWFVLDLVILAIVFIPLEAFFPHLKDQKIVRQETRTDLVYFAVGHMGFQFIMLLTQKPADEWLELLRLSGQQSFLAELPLLVQVVIALFVADLTQYWIHRRFHTSSKLWRFHEIHHSIKTMDWLAGSRLHLVDILFVRLPVYTMVMYLGLAPEAVIGYILFMAFHTVFIHANVGISFGWLAYIIATPQYHHWHHNDQPETYNKNFAVHFPVIDMLFGTFYLPKGRWPEQYGVSDLPYSNSYWSQLIGPFKK